MLAVVLFLPVQAYAVSAQCAVVIDAATGRLLYDKNSDKKSLIASTTKIMTALLICEKCNVLDQIRIPKEAVGIEGSSMYLQESEILSLQELLYGLMLSSGNDAAVALALFCCGNLEEFACLMNDKAHELGMKDTHFENPHGLDSKNHYSTAQDLAKLAAYAMENPIFAKTVSAKTVSIGDRFLKNHNKLLWRYAYSDGVKTGYTKAAGRILVSSAVKNRRRLIAVTINAPDDWNDHIALLEDAFHKFNLQRIVTKDDYIGSISIIGGTKESVSVLAADNYVYSISKEETPQIMLPGNNFVFAPVAEGASAGFAYIILGGNAIDKIPVIFGETVEQAP